MSGSSNIVSVQWFFIPPIVGIVTFVTVITFATGLPVPVHASVWGLTILLFTILSILYMLFLSRGFRHGLLPTQVAAQGLLVCPLALRVGATMVEWVGVTMTICGSAVLLILYYHSKYYGGQAGAKSNGNKQSDYSNDIDFLPLPVALADSEGDIVAVSDAFLQATGLSRRDVMGYPITVLTPIDRDVVHIKGKDWKLLQNVLLNDKYCFCLEDIIETQTPEVVGAADLVDQSTTLNTIAVVSKRTKKELYRVNRYKRFMSAALIRVIFDDLDSTEAQDEIFNIYCKYIKKNIRLSDSASVAGKRDIFLLLPETNLEGANIIASKLVDITTSAELTNAFLKLTALPRFLDKALFFGPPSNDVTFDNILSRLTASLGAPE